MNRQRARRALLLLAGIVLGVSSVFSQELHIGYQDKSIYVPGSEILVRMTIRNTTGETFRFKLAQNRMFNINFTVSTLQNQPLPPAPQFITERTTNQQLFYRDVALEPGEEFSFVEDLSTFVSLRDSGVYRIEAIFFPELFTGAPQLRASNTLSLTVRPPLHAEASIQARIDEQTMTILQAQDLPPDQVVEFVLNALQQGAWNRYFLYTDVEGLLLSDPARARAYRRLSAQDRGDRLAEFRVQVEQQIVEPELSAVPSDYQMVRTTYSPEEATVVMDLRFSYPSFTEIKRYTYSLRRSDGVWYIFDYGVTNLGAE
jgi:hypothetical protein